MINKCSICGNIVTEFVKCQVCGNYYCLDCLKDAPNLMYRCEFCGRYYVCYFCLNIDKRVSVKMCNKCYKEILQKR